MINKNNTKIFFLISLLTLLIISSSFSLATIESINKEKIKQNLNILKITKVNKNVLVNSMASLSEKSLQITNDYEQIISDEIYPEYNPSIAVSGNRAIIFYETLEEDKTKIYYKRSSDNFQYWSEPIYVDATFNDITYNTILPSFTKITTINEYFGTFLTSDNSSYIFELSGYHLQNLALWDYTNITSNGVFIGDFYDFKTPDLISYPDSIIPWVMGVIGKGEFIEEYDELNCNDSPMFFYKDVDNPSSSRTIVFFPEVSNCSNMSICLGENNVDEPMIYGVCEITNNTRKDLLFFHGTPDIWNSEDLLRKYVLVGTENLIHPKIYAEDNNIYIVAETSSQEIIMYYSNNYGSNESWILKKITQNILDIDSKSVYPEIYAKDTHVFCSFIESGNLTVTASEDFGVHWMTPYVINSVNGTVVEGYHHKEMANNHIFVWTDNRNGNFDIYFYVDYIAEVDLELLGINLAGDLQPFNTKNLLQISVKNNGDAIARSIKMNVTFTFKDGTLAYSDKIFEIDYLMPGENVTISRYLFNFEISELLFAFIDFAGIVNIAVEVDPEDSTGDVDFSNNYGHIGGISYSDIFPIIGSYEDLFLWIKEFFY